MLWLIPLGFGLFAILQFILGDWAMAIAFVVAAVVTFAGYNSARLNGWLLKRQLKSALGQTVTLTLADDELRYVAGPSTGTLAWSAVHDVIEDRKVVIITREATVSWAIIPRAAFADETEIAAFIESIRRRRDQARRASAKTAGV